MKLGFDSICPNLCDCLTPDGNGEPSVYIPASEGNMPHICHCLQETHFGITSLRTTKALSLTNGQQLDCLYPCTRYM